LAKILFKNKHHRVLLFQNLVEGDEGIQCNQFLIQHGNQCALLDPGGLLSYAGLAEQLTQLGMFDKLRYVVASHQDPDVIGSLDKWLLNTPCQVAVSKLWARFFPHITSRALQKQLSKRLIALPDAGQVLPLAGAELVILPAHYLHSVGNFSLYDPESRILFSGDIGASVVPSDLFEPVTDFQAHVKYMDGFHRRYMVSNKALKLWVNMVRDLDPELLVPQHGRYFSGKESISQFLDWLEGLRCGVDLINQHMYRAPDFRRD